MVRHLEVSAASEVTSFVVAADALPSNVRVVVPPHVEPEQVLAIARAAKARGFPLEDEQRVVGAAVRDLRAQLAADEARLRDLVGYSMQRGGGQRGLRFGFRDGRFHLRSEMAEIRADIQRLEAALQDVPEQS